MPAAPEKDLCFKCKPIIQDLCREKWTFVDGSPRVGLKRVGDCEGVDCETRGKGGSSAVSYRGV